jgi:hypothetical protein
MVHLGKFEGPNLARDDVTLEPVLIDSEATEILKNGPTGQSLWGIR